VLATYAARLSQAEAPSIYRMRVKMLAANDPDIWYQCGVQELAAKEPRQAWESWRRCLELSDRYLAPILEASAAVLGPGELIETVLPDRAEVLLSAAFRLYPEAGAEALRRPFLEKALILLERETAPFKPEQLHTRATAHKHLGQHEQAVAAYHELLAREPENSAWRCELAQVLFEQGKLEEARRSLAIVLTQQPGHAQARELLGLVVHELARKR
jgi:tetratricopeptide (TPR) repeat protein